MKSTTPRARIVQISDSHLGPDRDFTLYGFRPFDALERVVTALKSMLQPPDCIIHTGDMSQDRSRDSYALLNKIIADCPIPIYYLNGNHDSAELMHELLGVPVRSYPDKPVSVDYRLEIGGQPLLMLDSRHPDHRDPLGYLNRQQLAWLDSELAEIAVTGQRALVCIHHAPFPIGSPWFDANMILENGDELHPVLAARRLSVHAVIHGHLHRSMTIVRDGVVYAGSPSITWHYLWEPWRTAPATDPATPPMYTVIDCFADRVQLSHYAL